MTNEEDSKNKAGLVPSPAAALSRGATASLASRGMQDLLAREDAEQWYERGLNLRAQEEYEQEYTGARLLCNCEENLELLDLEGYG
jgi:hypothetical protein